MYQQTSKYQSDRRSIALVIGLLLCLLVTSCAGLPEEPATSAPAPGPTDTVSEDTADVDTPVPPSPTAEAVAAEEEGPAVAPTDTPVPEASPTPTTPPPAPLPPVVVDYNTVFILDASGSMMADLGGRTRLAIAQDAVGDLSAGLPAAINAGLWVYGHRVEQDDKEESCRDIEEVIGLGPVDPEEFDAVAHSFAAKGYTPITDALLKAASSLPVGPSERNSVVLVSDGEETCGGDPCALAAELAAGDIELVIHTIGLAVDDVTRDQLECIADVSGGTYTDAETAEDLSAALEEAAEAASDETFSIVEGLGRPSVVVVSPDGRHVYVTGAEAESVVVFSREPGTGRLTFVEAHFNEVNGVLGIDSPRGMAISPDGKSIYAAGGDDQAMAIFDRDPETGALTFVEAVDVFGSDAEVDRSHAVAVSPDNVSVYVTGTDDSRKDGSVAVFDRDVDTGRLSLVEMVRNDVIGADGLRDLTWVTVSPDNRSVYVLNVWHTMVVFSREPGASALTFAQLLEDNVDVPNNGLLGAHVVAVSPDNQHVYVTAIRGGTVTVFGRDPDIGTLTFADQLRSTIGDTQGNLYGAHGFAISPDGQHAYLASHTFAMLLSLSRDPQAGTLALIQEFIDNIDGVDGLDSGYSVAVSPDGINVYVAGFDDDSLAVFGRDSGTGLLSFTQVIRNKTSQ